MQERDEENCEVRPKYIQAKIGNGNDMMNEPEGNDDKLCVFGSFFDVIGDDGDVLKV